MTEPLRLLLIDDDAVDRKAVLRALGKSALTIDVHEAVDIRRAKLLMSEHAFDCILLDYLLPDGDGITIARSLLDSDNNPSVPIVMLTGKGSETIAVEAMKCGIQDYIPKEAISPESLTRAINNAIKVISLHKEIREMHERFERMAMFDSLSGLANRNLFADRLDLLTATARRNRTPFSLFMMDLDKFKAVNDRFGHEAGDEVLRQVGERLRKLGRDADMFFRLGGDEFTALITTGATRDGVEVMARRIVEAIRVPVKFGAESLHIGVSIGIALSPEHGDDGADLLRRADEAMYDAKQTSIGYAFSRAANS